MDCENSQSDSCTFEARITSANRAIPHRPRGFVARACKEWLLEHKITVQVQYSASATILKQLWWLHYVVCAHFSVIHNKFFLVRVGKSVLQYTLKYIPLKEAIGAHFCVSSLYLSILCIHIKTWMKQKHEPWFAFGSHRLRRRMPCDQTDSRSVPCWRLGILKIDWKYLFTYKYHMLITFLLVAIISSIYFWKRLSLSQVEPLQTLAKFRSVNCIPTKSIINRLVLGRGFYCFIVIPRSKNRKAGLPISIIISYLDSRQLQIACWCSFLLILPSWNHTTLNPCFSVHNIIDKICLL